LSASALAVGPLDFRLVAVALATWLTAYGMLHTRAQVALAVAGVAVVTAAGLWHPHRRGAAWAGVVLAVLLGVVCGSVATAARLAARDAAAIAVPARANATVTVELTVRRDPQTLGLEFGRPGSWLVPALLHRLQRDGTGGAVRVHARILVLTGDPGWQALPPGQRVRATGRLAPPRGGDLTAAVLSVDGPPELLGLPPAPLRAADSLRAGLRLASAPLPPEPGGLLPGLAVGDISNLDPSLSDDFFTTGMTHLLSVSGANCVIVTGFVFLIARAARSPPWLTAVVSGLALVGYVVLCQASPSVLRAGVMGLIALVALAAGRLRAALPALAATVVVLVVMDPQLAGNAGFTMSVLATAGLLLLAPGWRNWLRRCRVPPGLAEALAVPAAAQVAVSPVIAGLSGTISLVAVVANLVAAPVVAPATILGVLAAAVSPVSPASAELLAWLASWPAWWLVLVAKYGAQAPAAVVPWPDGVPGALLLAGLTALAFLALRQRRMRALVAVVTAAVVVGALPVRTVASGWPPDGAVVVACAVGQGDLLVIPVAAGSAIVVDAGPEPAAADRCLRDLRVRSVPLLVISHFHADHVGGIEGVFRGRRVAAVLAPGLAEPEPGHELLATVAAGAATPVQVPPAGTGYQVGEVSLAVLGPPQELGGTRSDANNNSLVIRAEVRGVSVLLTGDAEVELQRALLEQVPVAQLRADVLKVAHHGSVFQEPAFIDAVAPSVALVPVGSDNSYGHPHPAILDRLDRAGVAVLRTDTDGDVAAVQLAPGQLAVVTRPLPPGRGSRRPGRALRGGRPAPGRHPTCVTRRSACRGAGGVRRCRGDPQGSCRARVG
jgi:competence protein ComEC